MMNLFLSLLLSWTIGLVVLMVLTYIDSKRSRYKFEWGTNIWRFVGRFAIGASCCFLIAALAQIIDPLRLLIAIAALCSSSWLPDLIKKLR